MGISQRNENICILDMKSLKSRKSVISWKNDISQYVCEHDVLKHAFLELLVSMLDL